MKKLNGKFFRNKLTGELMFYTDDSMLKFPNIEVVEFVNGEEVGKRTIKVDDKVESEAEEVPVEKISVSEEGEFDEEDIIATIKKGKKSK